MNAIQIALQRHAHPEKARILQHFFKTGKGQYGEGDVFIGVTVPETRAVAKKFMHVGFREIEALLNSKVHEHRLCGLLILVLQFQKKPSGEIIDFYLKHFYAVNNWDLVDLTADKILGAWLADKDRSLLYKLAKSNTLWERRAAIVATYAFIRNNDFKDTCTLAEGFLNEKHDLMHKAVGWMLREAGKRDEKQLRMFLERNAARMPRTMLRYAIERLHDKKKYLAIKNTSR